MLLAIVILALLFWLSGTFMSWVVNAAAGALSLFGWGLALIAIAVIIIMGMLWRQQLSAFIHRWKLYQWNKWLGAVAFILAIWGTLALLNLGGSFGLYIIGSQDFIGALRILGLTLIGVILIAPGALFRFVTSPPSRRGKLAPKPTPQQKPAPPLVIEPHRAPEMEARPEPERETTTPVPTRPPAEQELKQVAQEVWKKYGESPAVVTVDGWRLPPIDILDRSPEAEFGQADNVQRANRKMKEIRERDRDGSIKVRLEEVSKTRIKVERITSLANDLALALAAPSIRIEAPVPGKSVVGVEVPNTISTLVSLRGVIETSLFQKIEGRSKLCLALGKGAGGEAIAADLSKMPHLLIAGATGSGKTVCLNSIICCLLLHNTPNDVRFIMIDPKRVELTPFNSTPHLATPVIVDTSKALSTLRWLNQQMDKRYQQLATAGARNIEAYNKNKRGDEKLPYLILIIDELADLMMAGFDEVEHILCRLAQLARATGIHLVVATQRPSVDVVTGLIKANFPTRISFAVTSQVDSRTILDSGGAEKLLGRGDMLYMPTEAGKPKRLQGCYVSDAETERLVYFWGSQRREEPAQLKIEEIVGVPTAGGKEGFPEDPLLATARQLAEEHKHISTSFLQRRLHIGYPRAARIMEQLEEEGIKEEE